MRSRWIIGSSDYLDLAFYAWKQACQEENVIRIEVTQDSEHEFDLGVLDGLSPADGAMFVAFDERFGNFKRMELMQLTMARGFSLEPFVSTSAVIAADAVIGRNCFIGDGVVVGAGSRIDYNTVLHSGVKIGSGVHLRASCWCDIGVSIGHGTEIGAHAILRMGAVVGPGVKIGRHCELGWPRLYDRDVPSRTVYDTRYDEPILVYGK
ncbi:UDP-3-O-(3-hydroxymyristoyl)glucosamine N-acyltransferase [Xanthomonas melonis]|uniref:UDP-3-O-(3-hydroxymyristoyl)glucosamine N-acyltransferase n=1 Tax=Xanthomonas melonis TaxID=56456 RepID=A0ABS8NS14_9XANT|nr:UDP-3-O-(3-hydroxymyristoyl)glucosamine N-acyltransferase [Xanthomonas melonis]MCD0257633.1 UDP-3-O-(3-hydroxymyristoyl)glucosamine N-acyltransferase [Xanthomonas melonis]MCD0265854.1 UDP-3-O-(3-hydroxymyristoyl)glucosamine N-acyltransferase [Xanthomonas melonis]MCD0278786.1 UDP-3-O-(3-hydroxymyristoyl)glucosamine N-acyltransferase [Xanthomonas melonis]